MKYIKTNEGFKHSYRPKNELIKSIFGLSEDDLFDYLSEITDEYDANVECEFILVSPNRKEYIINNSIKSKHNELDDEAIEGYANIGFKPIIKVSINLPGAHDNDLREIQSTATECILAVDDYQIHKISKEHRGFEFTLVQDFKNNRSLYHKKGSRLLKPYFKEMENIGYKIFLVKNFEKDDKFYIKHQENSIKRYFLHIEKRYPIKIEMINELAIAEKAFQDGILKLFELPEFHDTEHSTDFEIEANDRQKHQHSINVRFVVILTEK